MGCGGSKVKPQAPQAVAPPPPKPVVEAPPPKSPSVSSEPEVVEEPPTPRAVRLLNIVAVKESAFVYKKCTVKGEVTAFFPPKGRCFRIIDNEGRWFFYNDTVNYEMCVQVALAPESEVEHCEGTTVKDTDDEAVTLSAVVYPLETLEFLSGSVQLTAVEVYAERLSQRYYDHLQTLSEVVEEEVEAVMGLPWSETGDDELLKLCSDAQVRYTDVKFLPSTGMFSRLDGDGRFIQPTEVRRPSEYIQSEEENFDAVRGAVISSCVDGGMLGDSWFVSALSLLATDGERVRGMFASTTDLEKKMGAYRVLLNKDGWWRNVLVDDLLPTVEGVPCYARCIDDPAELWPSLLQKAYAKLYGSYSSITGGDTLLALQNFTGAPVHRFDKAWCSASANEDRKDAFLLKIESYTESHVPVIFSVPTGKKATIAVANGLSEGYSYALLSVHNFPEHNITLLKMFNPWEPVSPWSGKWRQNSNKWTEHSDVQSSCEPHFEVRDGTFFLEWSEAANVFDGCGVLHLDEKPVYDYRIAGEFDDEWPNLVLMIEAKETVEVMLTLSQRDKRGLPLESPDVKLSPILLCVSRAEGNKQFVYQCSSSDPENPAHAFNFVVGRDIGMKCAFEASKAPYFVIPRLHRHRTPAGHHKNYVIGIRSTTPLDGKLNVRFTRLEPHCRVFHNCVTFAVHSVRGVAREWQVKYPGEEPVPFLGWSLSEAGECNEGGDEVEAVREYVVARAEAQTPSEKSQPQTTATESTTDSDEPEPAPNAPKPQDAPLQPNFVSGSGEVLEMR